MIRQDWSTLKKLMFAKTAAAGAAVTEATAMGNPLTFLTDLARPLKSLLIPFSPIQQGTGDPSPSNIRPIIPWDGLTVWHGGGNLMPHPTKGNGVNPTTGASTTDATRASTDFIPAPLTGNKSYTFSGICDKMNSFVASYNANKQFLGRTIASSRTEITVTKDSFTSGTAQGTGDIAYLRFAQAEGSSGHSIDEIDDYDYMMNVGSSAMPYEEYHQITDTDIVFPSAVYGGTLDVVSGVLTVTHVLLDLHKSDFTQSGSGAMPYRQTSQAFIIQHKPKSRVDWNLARQQQKMNCAKIANPYGETAYGEYIGVCLWDTTVPTTIRISQSAYDALQDNDIVSICYEIDDPFEITLTPAQITSLVGNNTIWSDADGSMTATYLKKG